MYKPTRSPSLCLSRPRRTLLGTLMIATLGMTGCSSDNDNDTGPQPFNDEAGFGSATEGQTSYAFLSSVTPNFDVGQIERLTLADTIIASGKLPPAESDIRVATDGSSVYQIGRLNIDSISRFDAESLELAYQYSVLNESPESTNPQDLVFVSDTKAYVVQYGTNKVLIVNPSATDESGFIQGELDLSAYGEQPRAADAELVGDKLFVVMQRLTPSFAPVDTSYVAVFDTTSDTEIDTAPDSEGLPGIELGTTNVQSIQYLAATDELYITSSGNAFGNEEVTGDPYQGGIEALDPETYTVDLQLDDGTAESNRDFFTASLVVSAERGYVLTYSDTDTRITTLRTFNPETGLLDEAPVAGFEGQDLSVLQQDPRGLVWVGKNGDAPGFTLLDPVDNRVVAERVTTKLNPTSLVFIDVPSVAAE